MHTKDLEKTDSLIQTYCRGVAISRIIDDKHHPSDVVAGAFLGTLVACFFLARSIPHCERLTQTEHSQEYLLYGRSQIPDSNDNL